MTAVRNWWKGGVFVSQCMVWEGAWSGKTYRSRVIMKVTHGNKAKPDKESKVSTVGAAPDAIAGTSRDIDELAQSRLPSAHVGLIVGVPPLCTVPSVIHEAVALMQSVEETRSKPVDVEVLRLVACHAAARQGREARVEGNRETQEAEKVTSLEPVVALTRKHKDLEANRDVVGNGDGPHAQGCAGLRLEDPSPQVGQAKGVVD